MRRYRRLAAYGMLLGTVAASVFGVVIVRRRFIA